MAQKLTQMMASLETTDGCEDRQQVQLYGKDSMDRFGDDLCELLLSYFPFEDQFRWECVSKQFQRTVFKNVVNIVFGERYIDHLEAIIVYNMSSNVEMLTKIVKKCPNIQTVDFRGLRPKYEKQIPLLLNILRKNCQHLREIYCNISATTCRIFPTFGPMITRISKIPQRYKPYKNQSFIHCHRLSHLTVVRLHEVFDTSGQLLVQNLRYFEFQKMFDDYELLSTFVAHNQSLKSVVVSLYQDIHESFPEMCGQLSRLTQLRELTLHSRLINDANLLKEFLRIIGLNCKHMQSLTLNLLKLSNDDEPDPQFNGQTMDSLRYYHRLKRFNLTLSINQELLEPLKFCHRLTHLTVKICEESDKFLDNCHQNWPRLQYLDIEVNDITRETVDHILRLPSLQTLRIRCRQDIDLSDYDLKELLSRNVKLKYIAISAKNDHKCHYRQNAYKL